MKPDVTLRLAVPPRQWARFRDELLRARRGHEEVIGFFFCHRHPLGPRAARLLPRAWVVPAPDCYERQSAAGLALRQDFHAYLIDRYVSKGLDVVHVHTHPGSSDPDFSGTDDHHEREYARFLARLSPRACLASGVFNETLERGRFRVWPAGGGDPQPLPFTNHWAGVGLTEESPLPPAEPRFDRQKVFGAGAQRALGELRVGLVGCGGIGSVLAEQLARLGVRRWVLIDPDRVDESNLNRLPGATPVMASKGWTKVRYVKGLIRRAWPSGAEVRCLSAGVEGAAAQRQLSRCDVIAVATDNHHSRLLAQEVALRYVRPLLCLGTHVALGPGEGPPRLLARVTVPPVDGGWCLMCGEVIDPHEAALEALATELSAPVRQAGYVPGVAAPAVYWLNAACASLGAWAVHGTLSGLVEVGAGLDWALDLTNNVWLQVPHEDCPTCFHCSPEGKWAAGPSRGLVRQESPGAELPPAPPSQLTARGRARRG
jgi:hypothetical protein